ncbi:MAG: hypothetical protein RLN85_06080, partial [Pseudomonadales bacterium]
SVTWPSDIFNRKILRFSAVSFFPPRDDGRIFLYVFRRLYGTLSRMSNPNRQQELMRRRVFVRALLDSLSAEMRVIDGELRTLNAPPKMRLDQKFYEEVLVPILAKQPNGLTTQAILRELKENGLTVGDNQLRVFLSRAAGEKKLLDRVDRAQGPSTWKLAKSHARVWGLKREEI